MPGDAINAYKTIQQDTMDGRDLESSLLIRAAMLLRQCQETWADEGINERLDHALRFNQRLWTFFQAELMEESNPLPKELRQNLLNLSTFVDKRTFDILSYPAPEKLTVLININKQIAEGLASSAAAQEPAPGP